jgi:glycosyltransferase involved in cell wall biosynthesis
MLLLRLMRILKEDGYYVKLMLKDATGSLLDELKAAADECFVYRPPQKGLLNTIKKQIRISAYESGLEKVLANTDVLVSNTITNGGLLEHIVKYYNGPIISYIHELEMGAGYFTTAEQVESVLRLSNHFFVPSESVKHFLMQHYAVPAANISKLSYYIPCDKDTGLHIVKANGIKGIAKSFVVGGMGTPDWRKSPDLFVLVAKKFFEQNKAADVKFIWKGVEKNSVAVERLQYDTRKLGLNKLVFFEDHASDTSSFYENIDLFLLTSREDPYPLVVLEAASFGKPSVCFNDAGGATEFIEEDAGASVPYLAIDEMADLISAYYHDRQLLSVHEKNAYQKVLKLHGEAQPILDQFKKIIASL